MTQYTPNICFITRWSDGTATGTYTHWDTGNPDLDQTLGSYCTYQKGHFNDGL